MFGDHWVKDWALESSLPKMCKSGKMRVLLRVVVKTQKILDEVLGEFSCSMASFLSTQLAPVVCLCIPLAWDEACAK